MNEGEFIVRMVKLPGTIGGAVRLSEDGFANIYINDQLSPEARKRAFLHEAAHVDSDDFFNDKTIQDVEGA